MGCIDERRKNIMIWKFCLFNGTVLLDKFIIKKNKKRKCNLEWRYVE